ncbi:GPW/gp25 family protein [Pedobacter punctiformis]|uniref:GPW/gp25 family protein n=1 Tax=Pedobacter punctiformis TaxID=3004097 RepID=A0ABT4L6F4_9SPHI|nr:GPW/gp25 family protein [Pedobacter sp. HCMS5-2]MCZ4242384.1 GPW/gp25 family protein [Pedobacter sp. HCMS5-2]
MYFKFPIYLGELLEGRDLQMCGLGESIAQHIQLLITTRFGENRYDFDYGNKIWEVEFENNITTAEWEEQFRLHVINSIQQYEQRIENPTAQIFTEMVEKEWPMKKFTEVRKKVTILIKADLTETKEAFSFKTELFLSPMSVG